jgi:hypothetical protein
LGHQVSSHASIHIQGVRFKRKDTLLGITVFISKIFGISWLVSSFAVLFRTVVMVLSLITYTAVYCVTQYAVVFTECL